MPSCGRVYALARLQLRDLGTIGCCTVDRKVGLCTLYIGSRLFLLLTYSNACVATSERKQAR